MIISKQQKEDALRFAQENQKEYGLSCSESVFNALIRAGILDIPESNTCLATGFSGGVAASGLTCGAVYGALMSLGYLYGRKTPLQEASVMSASSDAPEEDYRYYMMRRFNRLINDFIGRHGSCQCMDFVQGAGGYFEQERISGCLKLIVSATELALLYIEMDDHQNRSLPFGHNIYGWQ